MSSDLLFLTASEILPRLRAGTVSVEAYARACLDRIAARDPQLHAWAFVDPDLVLAQARALDAADIKGPLHGLPIGIKDVILTRDMPTQYNSEIYQGAHPRMDAACVSVLRSAGALIIGKTETVEFAATGRPPPTVNPHDFSRTPGGSSSGSAAAVADLHVPLALGTQTGGSMIRPASFCGVFGMKPTWGLVSREGAKVFAPTLDTIGWFARSAADLALLYNVFDHHAGTPPAFTIAGSRIALCRSPMWDHAENATRAAFAYAADRLRASGAIVTELELPAPFEGLSRIQGLIMRAEGGASFLPEHRADSTQLHASLRDQVENADGITRDDLRRAYDVGASCRPVFDALAKDFDAVLTPSIPGEAPIGLAQTGAMTFNAMWTLLHVPCINVPGFVGRSGMPVGLTLTGPRYNDTKILAVADAVGRIFSAP